MNKLIVFAVSAMLFWGCKNTAEERAPDHETRSEAEHQHHGSSEDIELDNGKKWLVNEEMKPFVLKGEELVNSHIRDNQTDYGALARQLKDQNSRLVESCTMNGKSHDELHKWLHPHLEAVKALETETDAAKANRTVLQLQRSYQRYHQHFN